MGTNIQNNNFKDSKKLAMEIISDWTTKYFYDMQDEGLSEIEFQNLFNENDLVDLINYLKNEKYSDGEKIIYVFGKYYKYILEFNELHFNIYKDKPLLENNPDYDDDVDVNNILDGGVFDIEHNITSDEDIKNIINALFEEN